MKISQGMTYGLAAALVALATREAVAPQAAARGYGVPLPAGTGATPYLEVKANRDLVLAGLLVVASLADSNVLARALVVGAVAPVADAYTVLRHGPIAGTGVHLATAAYTIVAAILAARGN